MKQTGRRLALGTCCISLAALLASSANANGDKISQTPPPPENTELMAEGPPVIVTAERRSQAARNVPISLAILTDEDLEKAKINSIMDAQKLVPGLHVTQASTGQNQIFIRGIGTNIVGAGVEDAVAVYIDGVYQSRSSGTAMQFIDVERVEVLKGPQGTLYGRNATGGAINIISKTPSAEATGQFDVQAGSHNQRIARGTISGPLAAGVANARLSLLYNHDDGDTSNLLLNRKGNSTGIGAVRGSLELLPGTGFNLIINAHRYEDNFTTAMKPLYPGANPLFSVFRATVIDDPRTVMQNVPNEASLTESGLDATAKWDLGSAVLTSITAVRKTSYNIKRADLDGTEVPLMNVGSPTTGIGIPEVTNFFSQEFTLASAANDPLVWTGLIAYSHQKVDAPGFNFSLPLFNRTTNAEATVVTDAFGLGGQATYAVTDGLHLTGGARYSTETKKLAKDQAYINDVLVGSMSDKKTWSSLTPKFVVDYAPNRNTMFYASAAKGFKSGGYNTVAIQPAFSPETALNYEAGVKASLLGGRLRLNLAAFHTKYEDMQVSLVLSRDTGIYSVIKNAARAVSRGVEASVAMNPSSRIELSGNLQLLNARFVDFSSIDPRYPAQGEQNWKGNPLSRAPDRSAQIAAQYHWPTANDAVLSLRGEGQYRSKIYYTPFKSDFTSDPGLTVWNAFLGYESASKAGIYGAVFVKNLSNKTYTKAIFDPQSLGYLAYYAPARAIGMQIGYRF